MKGKPLKIKKLLLQNFMGMTFDIQTEAPIQVFFGPNASGKSAIMDSMYWLFFGNLPHRGLEYKKQSDVISNGNNKTLKVQIETDDGVISRTFKSEVGLSKMSFGLHSFTALLNPMRIIGFDRNARQRLFGQLVKQDATAKEIKKLLSVQKIADEYVDWVVIDADNAQTEAVALRRETKRVIKELDGEQDRTKPERYAHILGEKLDLTRIDLTKIRATLKDRIAERDSLANKSEQSGALTAFEHERDGLLEQKEDLENEDELVDPKIPSDLMETAYELENGASNAFQSTSTTLSSLMTKIKYLQSGDHAECPTCQQSILPKVIEPILKKMIKRQEQLQNDLNPLTNKWEECKKITLKHRKEYDAAVAAESVHATNQATVDIQLETLETKINAILDPGKDNAKKGTKDLPKKIKAITALIDLKRQYDTVVEQSQNRSERIEELQEVVRQMDAIDDLLKPDGQIRKIQNQGVTKLTYDGELAQAWSMDSLEIEPDGGINLHSRPIECASNSEKWRAAVLLSEMLARHQKFPWLLLDGVDTLVGTRGVLLGALKRWTHFNNIFINIAAAKPPTVQIDEGAQAYWVDGGEVNILNGS